MTTGRPAGRRSAVAWAAGLAALAAVAVAALAPAAHAHGQHELEIELYRGAAGPYELWVTAVPLTGFLEVAVTFEPDDPEARLAYAPRVVVTAERAGERLGPLAASRVFYATDNDYAATLAPPERGTWLVRVNIDSERGPASLALEVDVIAGRGFPWSAAIAGAGLLAPILWLAWGAVARRGRVERRRR